jgi:hypothetical protein
VGVSGSSNGRPALGVTYLAVVYLVIAVAALVALRANVEALEFLSVGWILVLAVLPLLPWLLPRLGGFLKEVSPYVQSVRIWALQLDFRALQQDAIAVPSSGMLAAVPNDNSALSSGTQINELVRRLRELRRQGGGPVGIIDLQHGHKWRLPNLYFLARLLELEPVVNCLIFTEMRGGIDGYFVGSCLPSDLRRQTEQSVTGYADASRDLRLPAEPNFADAAQAQEVGTAFQSFRKALPKPPVETDDDPVLGYLTTERVQTILARVLSDVAVEAVSETLTEENVRAIVGSPHPFVPATAGGRVTGFVDREAVALSVARAALSRK